MYESLTVGILDYTPLEYKRYEENITKQVIVNALKESMPDKRLIFPVYIRGLKDEIPDKKYDMFIISGSPLPTVGYSEDLDKAVSQITQIISEVPVLGICFGLHAIARITGNGSKMIEDFEIGPRDVAVYPHVEDIKELANRRGKLPRFPVNHIYKITNGNRNMKVIGVNNGGIQIADATDFFDGNAVMGVQFHPEFAATEMGWKIFRVIFKKTIDAVISGNYPDAGIAPIVEALPEPAREKLLKEITPNPENLIRRKLGDREKDLLMSLFHNIDPRCKQLCGRSESNRTYQELRTNSRALFSHFLKKALKAKKKAPVVKPIVKPGTQMKLNIRH